MPTLLDAALMYAGFGWHVMPLHNIENGTCTCRPSPSRPKGGALCESPGKHPRIKTGRAFEAATVDPEQIRSWWSRWPNANIGIATGQRSKLCVVDLDGQHGYAKLQSLLLSRDSSDKASDHVAEPHFSSPGAAALPLTLAAASGRDGIGAHLYFYCDGPSPTGSGDGLDVRGNGGLVVAPPSMHVTGRPYRWLNTGPLAAMPGWLLNWFNERDRKPAQATVQLPPHLAARQRTGLATRLASEREAVSVDDIWSALCAIPNADRGWDAWNRVGMAVWAACDGAEIGAELFERWSSTSRKHVEGAAFERWRAYAGTPPTSIGFGSLFYEARQNNPAWSPPSRYVVETVPANQQQVETVSSPFQKTNGHALNGHHLNGSDTPVASLFQPRTPDNPLIELNEKFAVIGNLGGKCMVLEWVPSKADESIEIPSFQTFRSFSERFAHRYVKTLAPKRTSEGEELVEKTEQLGSHWLKWHGRATYEGMDLDPAGPPVLEGNVLNLWKGFGVEARPGGWPLMRQHVTDVLSGRTPDQAAYVLRWAAWMVQNPGHQAEVALVFRGGKGTGKGTFARALRQIAGQHGCHIFSSKHLTGQFNAHLRSCIYLFADEAFWAGDKQGESTLKGLITEDTVPIEKKGVDLEHVVNRLHIVMAANADWVVPASHDERRYAVFDVLEDRRRDKKYFDALNAEMANGGLEAMLYDLQRMELGDWHPRIGIDTPALQKQKEASLTPIADWFIGILQDGYALGRDLRVPAAALHTMCKDSSGKLRDVSAQALGRFLKKHGVKQVHTVNGSVWEFPQLKQLRGAWEGMYGAWAWDTPDLDDWRVRR